MLDGDVIALRSQLRALEIKNEILEETLRQLRDVVRSPRHRIAPTWGLSKGEARMLILLAHKKVATVGQLAEAAKLSPSSYADPNSVRVVICRLRKGVARHGVVIRTLWGDGYALDEASRKIVQAAIFRCRQ